MTPKPAKKLPPISIRDKRLRGGRLDLQPGTDRKVERNRREAALRTLMDEGADGLAVIEQVRRRKLDLGGLVIPACAGVDPLRIGGTFGAGSDPRVCGGRPGCSSTRA